MARVVMAFLLLIVHCTLSNFAGAKFMHIPNAFAIVFILSSICANYDVWAEPEQKEQKPQIESESLEVAGVNFQKKVDIDKSTLLLNGAGIRNYKTFGLTVKIYVAALYLNKRMNVNQDILADSGVKYLKMRYFRGIDQDDMREAWRYYLMKNCPGWDCDSEPQKSAIEAFINTVVEAKEGDEYEYLFYADKAKIIINKRTVGEIPGAKFSSLLLSTWIGKVPPSEELKRNLLGT